MLGAIIGGATGALGGLFGSFGKNDAIKKQMQMIAQQQRENQDWYDRRYNEDATQRADAQRLLQMTEESIKKRNKAAAGTAAVMGGTAESVAAEKEANNKALADTTSQIAAAGEARKDQIEGQYRARKDQLDTAMAGLEGQKQSGLDIASNIIGGAGNGASLGMNYDLTKQYIDKL
jgi:hypothetical protein